MTTASKAATDSGRTADGKNVERILGGLRLGLRRQCAREDSNLRPTA
jgi:hypothetical protein